MTRRGKMGGVLSRLLARHAMRDDDNDPLRAMPGADGVDPAEAMTIIDLADDPELPFVGIRYINVVVKSVF